MNIPELVKIPVLIFQRPWLLIQTSINRSESGAIVAVIAEMCVTAITAPAVPSSRQVEELMMSVFWFSSIQERFHRVLLPPGLRDGVLLCRTDT